jgi:hypothetical protein
MASATGSCPPALVALAVDEIHLQRYDAACRAIAEATAVDEVKDIRDKATALRAYAKQAKNRQLEIDAAEIRIRAERRLGEVIAAQRESIGLSKGARNAGQKRTRNPDEPATLTEVGIDKHLADRARKLAALPARQFEHLVTDWRRRVEEEGERLSLQLLRRRSHPSRQAVHFSSATPEHYTPAEVLELVTAVFGTIDLDPCSNAGTPNVPARQHYHAGDNGLIQPWRGKVYVNPPYGRDIGQWTRKIREEWRRGEVTDLIALLPARTDTEWFNDLTRDTGDVVVCFWRGRLTFVGGHTDPAPFPSLVIYFGPQHDVFTQHFGGAGSLWQRPPLDWFVDHR